MLETIFAPQIVPEEEIIDKSLRPDSFSSYIGQSTIKDNLRIAISAAKSRAQSIDHILLYGPPGLGKTSLAYIIAKEMGSELKTTSGPAITKAGDLAAILTSLNAKDVLFIDEIHRLNRVVEEILYPAMEDGHIDIMLGKGPSARSVKLDLQPFTLVGATTKVGSLSHPLRDRFGHIFRLDFYEDEELAAILDQNADKLDANFTQPALLYLAERSRKTPRIANRLLKRVRDFATYKSISKIDIPDVKAALAKLNIDEAGLDKIDRLILETLIVRFKGRPVGLETLAASTGEEVNTIEDVIEPYLLRLGFIERTPRGRTATELACKHLGIKNI